MRGCRGLLISVIAAAGTASGAWSVGAQTSRPTQPAGPAATAPAPAKATPQPPAAPSAPPPRPGAAPEPASKSEAYSYNPEGRRDPFLSLLQRGEDFRAGAPGSQRPEGLKGLSINDAALRGIVRAQGGFVAILQAPDNRTYIVRPTDRLFDGSVKAITAEGVVFLQDVSDPLSLVKQREVRKLLRAPQEGR